MKKQFVLVLIILFWCAALSTIAQGNDSETLMTVGSRPVSLMEFKSMYYKNLPKDSIKNQKALDNYLKLFIDFRLKVNAAQDARLDTMPSFKQEMREYREKLADPYMHDQDVENHLVKEAYDRMHTDVRASHILIKVGPDAAPEDTLAAYKKIMMLRDRILKKQLTFKQAAQENSDDTYSKTKGGDLGYFTSLEMVYPFENAAFNTKIGEVSMPIRTQFGYHIITITERRTDPGQVQVAHIMLRTPQHMSPSDSAKCKAKIDSIYSLIKQGQDFAELAKKYSQDPSSGRAGGTLPMFGVGRMPAEFEMASFALKNIGDVSAPIQTSFGWHIIKLQARKGIPAFDSIKDAVSSRVEKDDRSKLATEAMINEVKKKYTYKEYPEAKKEFYKVIDEAFYTGKWTIDKAKDLKGVIFSLGTTPISQQDFAEFLSHNQMSGENKGGEYAVNALYPKFVKEECVKFKDKQLEKEYPAFAEMLQEYSDGILLFDITDKMVWSKALKDTTGLKKFYQDHKNDYMAPATDKAFTYNCSNSKVAKEVKDLIKEGKSDKEILTEVNQDPKKPMVHFDIVEKTASDKVQAGMIENKDKDGNPVIINVVKVPTQPKTLDEARGMVTTDYQNYLMVQWLADLKAKYQVQVNQQALGHVMPQ
jgi:peptidyl-prolyl cis-trans isomerase SurA